MIPSTQNSENNITQIEIENEVETTEIKKESVLIPAEIHEILKEDNTEVHEGDVEIINVENVDKDVTNEQENEQEIDDADQFLNSILILKINVKKLSCDGNTLRLYSTNFWVQNCKRTLIPGCHHGYAKCDGMPKCNAREIAVFLQDVFAALMVMYCVSAFLVGISYLDADVTEFFQEYEYTFLIVGVVGMLYLIYTVMYFDECDTRPRCNFASLAFTVICMSLILVFITVSCNTLIMFVIILTTIVAVFVFFCLALSYFDFTEFCIYPIAIFSVVGAVVCIIYSTQLVLDITYAPGTIVLIVAGSLINVIIMVTQLQMMLHCKILDICATNHVLGAFILYTSIADLFFKVVDIFNSFDNKDACDKCYTNECLPTEKHSHCLKSYYPDNCVKIKCPPKQRSSKKRFLNACSPKKFFARDCTPKDPCHAKDCISMDPCRPRDCYPKDCAPPGCYPKDCTPKSCYPKDCAPPGCYPKDCTPKSCYPKDCAPPGCYPKDCTPKSCYPKDCAPPGCYPKDCTPKSCYPKDCAPPGCYPKDCTPKSCYPKDCAPPGCYPKDCTPKGCYPKDCAPKGCYPKDCTPKGCYPQDCYASDSSSIVFTPKDRSPKDYHPRDRFLKDCFQDYLFPNNSGSTISSNKNF